MPDFLNVHNVICAAAQERQDTHQQGNLRCKIHKGSQKAEIGVLERLQSAFLHTDHYSMAEHCLLCSALKSVAICLLELKQ